ncbi:MAG: hypothetical protein HYV63_23435 [Candidatus Schekmanbacteria bacterium]|nr:hypothetical protein [Candidatus Schekmanbacteria bacterium]
MQLSDELSLTGFVEYEYFAYTHEEGVDRIDSRNEIQFHSEWTFQPSSSVKGLAVPELRYDLSDETRNRVFLDEAYVDIYRENADWRVGKQIVSWGRADTLRPTDLWKIRDYTDFFDDEEEGIVGAQGRFFSANLTVSLLWVPYFQRHYFPLTSPGNRFFLLPSAVPSGYAIPGLSHPGAYRLTYRELRDAIPDDTIDSSEGAIKLEYSRGGWDLSLSFSRLHDRLPTYVDGINLPTGGAIVVAEEIDDQEGNTAVLGIRPHYERILVVGMDVSTTFRKVGFRGEAAYVITSDRNASNSRIDDPYVKATVGLDYTISNFVGDQDLFVLLQYAVDVQLPHSDTKNVLQSDIRHYYEHAALTYFEWQISDYLRIGMRSFLNAINRDYQIEPEITWSPADSVTLRLGATMVGGRDTTDSFLSAFEKDDRAEASVRFSL